MHRALSRYAPGMAGDSQYGGGGFLRTLLVTSLLVACWVHAATPAQPAKPDLTTLSIEEVLSIRRSGVSSIPGTLHLAPDLRLARLDANGWAISARGVNGRFANRLLRLLDDRNFYTPWFSGMYGKGQDTLLIDVEHIEVLQGPGTRLWGDSQTLTVPSLAAPFSRMREDDLNLSEGKVLARWQRTFSGSSEMMLQISYDRTARQEDALLREIRDTIDFDFQHRFTLGMRQEIIWGLAYRYTRDDLTPDASTWLIPGRSDSRGDNLFSTFLQNDIILVDAQLRLILGSKFEHNDYTGFEVQPTVRLMWTPHTRHTLWAAFSRVVLTPSYGDEGGQLMNAVMPPGTPGMNPGQLPALIALTSGRDFASEALLAYEIGYRVRPGERLALDLTAFFNVYNNLHTTEAGMPFLQTSSTPPHLVIPLVFDQHLYGEAYGVELAMDWRPFDWWRLQVVYTYLQLRLYLDADSRDTVEAGRAGQNPHHQVSFRSSLDLLRNLTLNVWARYVDALPNLNVRSYVTLDVHLAWTPYNQLELAIVGQNLLKSHHIEFVQEQFPFPIEVERSVYGKITWRF